MQVNTYRNNVGLIDSLSLLPIKFTILNFCKNNWGGGC